MTSSRFARPCDGTNQLGMTLLFFLVWNKSSKNHFVHIYSEKYLFREIFIQRNIYSEKYLFREIFIQRNIYSEKYLFREIFIQRNIYSEKYLFREIFIKKKYIYSESQFHSMQDRAYLQKVQRRSSVGRATSWYPKGCWLLVRYLNWAWSRCVLGKGPRCTFPFLFFRAKQFTRRGGPNYDEILLNRGWLKKRITCSRSGRHTWWVWVTFPIRNNNLQKKP